MVLYVGTRPAFLLSWHRTKADDVIQWWGKVAVMLTGASGDEPSVGYRWVDSSNLKKLDGVDYSGVPTMERCDG
ncbi:hypothetical protein ABZ297_23935 [Nonomuraea sp. NPDC005983]|uniref:hypothetical protein n=1 Tax=Nonomuraea sp. NPDC005983 TaxID=3155595 RepID=UPI0033A2A570